MVHADGEFTQLLTPANVTVLALEAAQLGVWQVLNSGEVFWDRRTREIHGVDSEAPLTLEDTLTVVHPDDRANVQRAIEKAAVPAGRGYYEIKYRLHNVPSTRWVASFARVLMRNNEVVGFCGVVQDITAQKHAEEMRELTLHELNHRTKNVISIVLSLARKTLPDAGVDSAKLRTFEERLRALGRSQAALISAEGRFSADIHKTVAQAIAPFVSRRSDLIAARGPSARLAADSVITLSLVLHELLTNAVKYGSLSHDVGGVDLRWDVVAPAILQIVWREHGGPPVKAPKQQGFGTQLIHGLLSYNADNHEPVHIEYCPTGLTCTFRLKTEPGA